MAKGQQRSNREKKKPKKAKTASASPASQYAQQQGKGAPAMGLDKKR